MHFFCTVSWTRRFIHFLWYIGAQRHKRRLSSFLYAIWLLTTLIFFRRMIKNTLYPLILVYGTVFGCSIIIDKLIAEAYLIEDMLKFVGILNWSFYWTTSAFGLVQKNRVKQD